MFFLKKNYSLGGSCSCRLGTDPFLVKSSLCSSVWDVQQSLPAWSVQTLNEKAERMIATNIHGGVWRQVLMALMLRLVNVDLLA